MYPWLDTSRHSDNIVHRIPPPEGFERVAVDTGSFAEWLRYLPLKPESSPVYLHDGRLKRNQTAHVAVIDIDPGTRDLQQCADAVIRLRAEYLYSRGRFDDIVFNFTSGDTAAYVKWRKGFRPEVNDSRVRWIQKAVADSSYESFREYLDMVFTYAGTLSLERDLPARRSITELGAGDIFIEGGSPGHAVIVVDMAENKTTGKKVFLLVQSFMPAQNMHVLNNPNDHNLSPWYSAVSGDTLITPEYHFTPVKIVYFPE